MLKILENTGVKLKLKQYEIIRKQLKQKWSSIDSIFVNIIILNNIFRIGEVKQYRNWNMWKRNEQL